MSNAQVGAHSDELSVGSLVAEVGKDLSELMRQEVKLAKAEARQSAIRAGKGAGLLGGAATTGHLALIFLSIAIWWAIGNATGRGWAGLIVAVFWALVAAVMALIGKKQLQEMGGLERTAESVKKIPPAARGHEEQNR